MKPRKLSQHTQLEIACSDFVHISQRIHPRGHFDRYIKVDREEAKQLVRHLLDWVLAEENANV
ncbi:MAG: hypothetical protein ACFB4I_18705 [Cyanophyceae cyanobacterium]